MINRRAALVVMILVSAISLGLWWVGSARAHDENWINQSRIADPGYLGQATAATRPRHRLRAPTASAAIRP